MTRPLRSIALSLFVLTACVPQEPVQPIPPRVEHKPPPPITTAAPRLPLEPPPLVRLPADTRPQKASLTLHTDPSAERFSGTIEIQIELTRPRDVIWLHGKDLVAKKAHVRAGTAAPIPATYSEVDPSGVAALRLDAPVGPGQAIVHIEFDAPFGRTGEGLFVVERDGKRYAFTQFESIHAREAFPCFDEPAFKIPYDIAVFVPKGQEAISTSHEIERSYIGDKITRIVFATTEPLPSYLLAFAVGPLDVVNGQRLRENAVRKRSVALRGIATQGRGKELSYALAHTGEMVAALEAYTGIEYPYDKLDLIAVPEKRGAMENAGAITFGEWLLLVDEKTAPTSQMRAFWGVMMHELAHQWFGNLVTMPWWDDIWLNEAFATWAASRLVADLRPDDAVSLRSLAGGQGAMTVDSLMSARQVRQEVKNVHDIDNAFDSITYKKGGMVIGMFERFIGEDTFRNGIRAYLSAHQHKHATADDLFAALTVAAGRDIGAPFRTFVNQSGVPLVEAQLVCSSTGNYVSLKQSRNLPLGSKGDPDRTWQIPICAKFKDKKEVKEACTLLSGPSGALPLPAEKCPSWVMPNSDGAGYYVMSMPTSEMKKLTTKAWGDLSPREHLSVLHSMRAALDRGTPVADLLPLLVPLAKGLERPVVRAATEPFYEAHGWLTTPKEHKIIEKQAQRSFWKVWKDVAWEPKVGATEDDETRGLRADLLNFMARIARDPKVRKEAISRGKAYVGFGGDGALHPDVADKDLLGTCLAIAAEEGDKAFFDHLVGLLARPQTEPVTGRIVAALGSFSDPDLAERARALMFDAKIPRNEKLTILRIQLSRPATRDAAWAFFETNLDKVASLLPVFGRSQLVWLGVNFCDKEHEDTLSALFTPRAEKLVGGPRNLASALEAIHLCTARREAQEPSYRKAWRIPAPKAAPAPKK